MGWASRSRIRVLDGIILRAASSRRSWDRPKDSWVFFLFSPSIPPFSFLLLEKKTEEWDRGEMTNREWKRLNFFFSGFIEKMDLREQLFGDYFQFCKKAIGWWREKIHLKNII